MRSATTLKWVGLALLGIAIAAGISIAASRLASRQIGLASEPISAGDALAPVARPAHPRPATHGPKHRRHAQANPPATTAPEETTPSPPAETIETVPPEILPPESG